jgi:hypothetical protein
MASWNNAFIDNNTSFRKQIVDLFTGAVEIEIEREMLYHSWAIFLASHDEDVTKDCDLFRWLPD